MWIENTNNIFLMITPPDFFKYGKGLLVVLAYKLTDSLYIFYKNKHQLKNITKILSSKARGEFRLTAYHV